jgi:hypothetical protein
MQAEASAGWRDRLLRKGAIEDALAEYDVLLSDAARSFQIAALIDIHATLEGEDDELVASPTQDVGSPRTPRAPSPSQAYPLGPEATAFRSQSQQRPASIVERAVEDGPVDAPIPDMIELSAPPTEDITVPLVSQAACTSETPRPLFFDAGVGFSALACIAAHSRSSASSPAPVARPSQRPRSDGSRRALARRLLCRPRLPSGRTPRHDRVHPTIRRRGRC